MTIPIYLLFGLFSGFLGSLIGSGGGIFIVPSLTLFGGVSIYKTIPASLITVIATSNAGGSSYIRQGLTNVKLAYFLEVATTLGALTGSVLALMISRWILFMVFGFLLLYISVSAIRTIGAEEGGAVKRRVVKHDKLSRILDIKGVYFDRAIKEKVSYTVAGAIKGLGISFLAGIGSGLLGIGGGALNVGAINLFMNVPIKVAVGTSQFMLGATASTSAILFLSAGLVDFSLVAPLSIGTILGTFAGSWVMNRFRGSTIKVAIAFLFTYLSYAMLARGLLLGFGIRLPVIR